MFFDKFELTLMKIDDKPLKPEEQLRITFWDSGKIEHHGADGTEEPVSKDQVGKFIAQLGLHYGVTPEEFREAVEKEKQHREEIARIKKGSA